MEWKGAMERVVEMLGTPRPLVEVDCCVGSIDLNVSKKQIDFLAKLLGASSSSSSSLSRSESTANARNKPANNPTSKPANSPMNSPAIDSSINSLNGTAVKAEDLTDPLPQPAEYSSPVYVFGALPFALHLLNGLFSSRWLFFYVLGVLFSLPLLFFHPFFYLAMLLPLLIAAAADWIYLSRLYSKLNASIDPSFHAREQFAFLAVHWDGLRFSLTNDCVEPCFDPLSLSISPLQASLSLGKNKQSLHCQLDGCSLLDGVSTREKGRECWLLTSSPVSMKGEALPATLPLLCVDAKMEKKEIKASVEVGDLNCVVSPRFVLSVLEFIPMELLSEKPEHAAMEDDSATNNVNNEGAKETITTTTTTEQSSNEMVKSNESQSFVFKVSLSSVGVMVDTDTSFPLVYLNASALSCSGSFSSQASSLSVGLGRIQCVDATPGAGMYSSIVRCGGETEDPFVKAAVEIAPSMSVDCEMGEVSIAVRLRFVKEVIHFLTKGSVPVILETLNEIVKKNVGNKSNDEPESNELKESKDVNELNESNELNGSLLADSTNSSVAESAKNSLFSIHFRLSQFSLILPEASESHNQMVFSFSTFNGSMRDSLSLSLHDIHAFTTIRDSIYPLLPKFDLSLSLSLFDFSTIHVDILTPLLLTLSESSIHHFIHLVLSNIQESPLLDKILTPFDSKSANNPPTQSEAVVSSNSKQQSTDSDSHLSIHFHCSGIGVLFSASATSIEGHVSGSELFSSRSIPNSLCLLSVRNILLHCSLQNQSTKLEGFIESFGICDTRFDSPLSDPFRSLLQGGSKSKPFCSFLLGMENQTGNLDEESKLSVTARMGSISILPTCFVFSMLDELFLFANHLLAEVLSIDVNNLFSFLQPITNPNPNSNSDLELNESSESSSTSSSSPTSISLSFLLERIALGLIDNPHSKSSSVLLTGFGVGLSLSLSPSMDLQLNAKLLDLRSCRSDSSLRFPPTDMSDAIAPFALDCLVSMLQHPQPQIRVDVSTVSTFQLRFGVLDFGLVHHFLSHFFPSNGVHWEKYSIQLPESGNSLSTNEPIKPETSQSEAILTETLPSESIQSDALPSESINSEPKSESLQSDILQSEASSSSSSSLHVSLSLPEICFLLVNDALEFELPVLQLSIHSLQTSLDLHSALSLRASLSLSGDYYKQSTAVWEPYLEPWPLSLSVSQESFASSLFQSNDQAIDVSVHADSLLFLNVSAPLLDSLAKAMECVFHYGSSDHVRGDGSFIALRNQTGYPMSFHVIGDEGLNQTLLSKARERRQREEADETLWEGLVSEEFDSNSISNSIVWMEIHSQSPRIRVFRSIPTRLNEVPCEAVDRFERLDDHVTLPSTRILRAISLADAELWEKMAKSPASFSWNASNSSNSLGIPVSQKVETGEEVEVSTSQSFSSLLAHPSLALRFVGISDRALPRRLVSLKIAEFDPIQCNVDHERDVFVPLENRETGKKENVVFHNEVKNGMKVISVSSALCVENRTDSALFVYFSSVEGAGEWEPLRPNDQQFCPLALTKEAMLHVTRSPLGVSNGTSSNRTSSNRTSNGASSNGASSNRTSNGTSSNGASSEVLNELLSGTPDHSISLRNLSKNRVQSSLNIGTPQSPYFVRLVLHRSTLFDESQRRSIDTYRLCIVPILSFANLLPIPIDCLIVNGSTVLQNASLPAGERLVFHTADVNPTLRREEQSIHIRIRPRGSKLFSLFDESVLPILRADRQACWVFDAALQPLRLSYGVTLSAEGVVTVELFSDYWIVNRTNEELIVAEEKKKEKEDEERVIPAQKTAVIESNVFQNRVDSQSIDSIQPCLFSCHQSSDSNSSSNDSVFIRTQTSEWSEKLGIGAVGTTGITALKPRKGAEQSTLRVFGISITPAPLIFGMTKIVTISASMVLYNNTKKPISLRQVHTNSTLLLPPNQPTPFHWPDQKSPLEVEFQKSDHSWTDPCKLEVGESLRLLDEAKRRVLRVSCVMELEHLNVVLDFADRFNTELFIRQSTIDKTNGEENGETGETGETSIDYWQLLQNDLVPMELQKTALRVSLFLRGVGISLIDAFPREVMYCSLDELTVSVERSNQNTLAVSSSITRLQIDNSLAGSPFPVVFGALNAGEVEGDSVCRFLEVSLMLSEHPSVLLLDYLGVFLRPMSVSVDSAMLEALLSMLNSIAFPPSPLDSVSGEAILRKYPLLYSELPFITKISQRYLYIQELMLQPISVKISFHNDPSAPLTADLLPSSAWLLPLKAVLNTATSLVANLNNAALQLDSFAMNQSYIALTSFTNKLLSHYIQQVISKLYLLLGAFNLLGNPVELVGNLSEGVQALFFEPVHTLMKRPEDFVASVGKGTSKLVSMTAYGVLNSVSQITDSMTNGIAALNWSKTYQADRAAGKTGIVHGFTSGVKGLVNDTATGLQNDGLKGLVTGIGTGLAGVVLNPVIGTLESVTNVANEAKNRIHEEKKLKPVRTPRALPLDGFLLPYDPYLAEGAAFLAMANRSAMFNLKPNERYVIHFVVDDGARSLLLTTLKLLVLSAGGRVEGVSSLKKVELEREGAIVKVNQTSLKKMWKQNDGFHLQNEEIATLFVEAVNRIKSTSFDAIASFVREVEAKIQPQKMKEESLPSLDSLNSLAIGAIRYVSCTMMRAGESFNEDPKRKHVMYKVEVQGGDVVWNVYFRYTQLE